MTMCVDGAAQPRLRLEGITKSFDSILAVNDVSFAVQAKYTLLSAKTAQVSRPSLTSSRVYYSQTRALSTSTVSVSATLPHSLRGQAEWQLYTRSRNSFLTLASLRISL